MSEFKYACPVCGQHIQCDSSQSGSIMECPTCFQKIIAPQAPAAGDQKLILSGKKVEDRPATRLPGAAAAPLARTRPAFPLAAVALVVLLVGAATAAFLFRARLVPARLRHALSQTYATHVYLPPPEPVVVVPHASDTNWFLNLATARFPDAGAAGRIHGRDFLAVRSVLQSGILTLRQEARGPMEFGLAINFSGVPAELLAGTTINITTNTPVAARVTLRWKENGQARKDTYETGYALHVTFGELDDDHLAGRVYFCAPDDAKSYVAGSFTAEVRKGKPVKPKT